MVAVEALIDGKGVRPVALAAGVSPRTVQRWFKAYKLGGAAALRPRPIPGRPHRRVWSVVPPPCGRDVRKGFPTNISTQCLKDWLRATRMVQSGSALCEIEDRLGWKLHPSFKKWYEGHRWLVQGQEQALDHPEKHLLNEQTLFLQACCTVLAPIGTEVSREFHHRHPTTFSAGLPRHTKRRSRREYALDAQADAALAWLKNEIQSAFRDESDSASYRLAATDPKAMPAGEGSYATHLSSSKAYGY